MNAPRDAKTAPRISRRGEGLGTENAFVVLAEVNALARQGRDIVSFCIGQPDFPTPVNIQDAAITAIRAGKHGYTPSAGIDELREAAARDIGQRRGISIEPDDVVVGAGAKPFIAYAIASVTDFGAEEEVIYPIPGFPIYESQIKANGALPVPIHLRESRDFAFDPARARSQDHREDAAADTQFAAQSRPARASAPPIWGDRRDPASASADLGLRG